MSSSAAPAQPPPSRPVRFGILGCADIARKISRAMLMLPPGAATIVAVGSRSEDKACRFVAETGLLEARLHGSYESLLGDPDVEAVYLPLPTSLHVPWATAVAARGKHLLLEKPTALCAADLDAIVGACDAYGVQFMDTTMWIHHPRTAKMREIVSDKDAFGDVRVVRSRNGFFLARVRWNLEMPNVYCQYGKKNYFFSSILTCYLYNILHVYIYVY